MITPPLYPPCRACGTPRVGRHCHACGQSVEDEQSLTTGTFLRKYAERVTSVDRPLVHTATALLAGPGTLARRYLGGERKAFLSPLATFTLAIALYAATYVLYRDAALAAALGLSPAAAPGAANASVQAWVAVLVENMKYVQLLAALPLAVAFRWTMPRHFTVGEWFAAMLYAFALYIAVAAVALPLVYLLPPATATRVASVFTSALLFGVVLWTNRGLLGGAPGTFWRTLVGFALATAMLALLLVPVALALGLWLMAQATPPV